MSDAEKAKAIVGGAGIGLLSTIARDPAGYPFGSLVTYALDARGAPVFLISRLAEHTANALEDPRASLLVAEPAPAGEDPLAFGRVTLIGDLRRIDDAGGDLDDVRSRFLAAHDAASMYVDFPDFGFFRLHVQSVRYVGGFGRMSWVDVEEFAE